jgi:hypothetical protein
VESSHVLGKRKRDKVENNHDEEEEEEEDGKGDGKGKERRWKHKTTRYSTHFYSFMYVCLDGASMNQRTCKANKEKHIPQMISQNSNSLYKIIILSSTFQCIAVGVYLQVVVGCCFVITHNTSQSLQNQGI